jgi:hypothetical protein
MIVDVQFSSAVAEYAPLDARVILYHLVARLTVESSSCAAAEVLSAPLVQPVKVVEVLPV